MRPLRGALVGYGFISEHGHLPAYLNRASSRQKFDIVAVADTCRARLELAKRALPHARLYSSHQSMLAAERGRIDFVDITTPPCDHATIAHAALDLGLHVLCEKPLATRPEDARAMLEHARAVGRVVYPCHNYRHAPVLKAVNRILDSGALGRVHLVTLDTYRTTHARGAPEWYPDWRRDLRIAGGGITMDHGPHTFYLALAWLRAMPLAVTAKMSSRGPFDTEDTFSCTVTFPQGIASARLAWTAGVRKVIYSLHGERGAIRVEDDDVEVSITEVGGRTRQSRTTIASDWTDASHTHWFRSMQDQFAEAVFTGDFVGTEAQVALRCMEIIAASYTSSRERSREVELPHVELAAPAPITLKATGGRAS